MINSPASTNWEFTPFARSTAASSGALSRSPTPLTTSRPRCVNSPRTVMLRQRRSNSRSRLSNNLPSPARSTPSSISCPATTWCRTSSWLRASRYGVSSPAAAACAASISVFVTPPIALTTTSTPGLSSEPSLWLCLSTAAVTIFATPSIDSVVPTDVPPNFITIIRVRLALQDNKVSKKIPHAVRTRGSRPFHCLSSSRIYLPELAPTSQKTFIFRYRVAEASQGRSLRLSG